jgi:hypothetical protein
LLGFRPQCPTQYTAALKKEVLEGSRPKSKISAIRGAISILPVDCNSIGRSTGSRRLMVARIVAVSSQMKPARRGSSSGLVPDVRGMKDLIGFFSAIEYRAKSAEGKLRHPFFKGLREDL